MLYLSLYGGVALLLYVVLLSPPSPPSGARAKEARGTMAKAKGAKWAAVMLWVVTATVWTFACPLWAGPPLILKSVMRGPYYGSTLISWSSTSSTTPPRIYRAHSESDVIAEVRRAGHVRAVGTAHSYTHLYDTTGTSLQLAYCNIAPFASEGSEGEGDLEVSGGCKIDELRAAARARGRVVRGLGAIYQQSVGGSISTSLHGDDRLRFISYVRSVRVVDSYGNVTEHVPEAVDGALGESGIIVSAVISTAPAFDVLRIEESSDLSGVLASLERVRGNVSVFAAGSCVSPCTQWHRWEGIGLASAQASVVPRRAAGGVAWTFVIDNLVLPLVLLFPWLASSGVAGSESPFTWATDDAGRIGYHWAQEHSPVNFLSVSEIDVVDCAGTVAKLLDLAEPFGSLSVLVRPSETGCWIDHTVIPWAPGFKDAFHRAVYAALPPDTTYHAGKLRPPSPAIAGEQKFRLLPRDEPPLALDARRVSWIALVVTTFAVAAASFAYGDVASHRKMYQYR